MARASRHYHDGPTYPPACEVRNSIAAATGRCGAAEQICEQQQEQHVLAVGLDLAQRHQRVVLREGAKP